MWAARLKKKKMRKLESKRSQVSTDEILADLDIGGDDIVRLKVTVRKGARIESVPLKKLEKVASKKRRYWKFEKGWLMLTGSPQMLNDVIKTKHNSNQKTQQITLDGEIVQEYCYFVLGFVPADVVRLKKDLWFSRLNNEQIIKVEKI